MIAIKLSRDEDMHSGCSGQDGTGNREVIRKTGKGTDGNGLRREKGNLKDKRDVDALNRKNFF